MNEQVVAEIGYTDQDIENLVRKIEDEVIESPEIFQTQFQPFAEIVEKKFPGARNHKLWQALVGGDVQENRINADFPGDYSVFNFLSLDQRTRDRLIQKLWLASLREKLDDLIDKIEILDDEEKKCEYFDLINHFRLAILENFPDCRSYRIFHLIAGSGISSSYENEIQHEEDFPGDYSVENFLRMDWDDRKVLMAKLKEDQENK